MAAPSKTANTNILTHQAVTHPATVKGTATSVATKISGIVSLFHASVEAAANTNPGKFYVQTSGEASGDDDWVNHTLISADGGTAATEAMTAIEPSAETVLAVVSTTGFAAGDKIEQTFTLEQT